jgi:hypothetical protein
MDTVQKSGLLAFLSLSLLRGFHCAHITRVVASFIAAGDAFDKFLLVLVFIKREYSIHLVWRLSIPTESPKT